MSWRMCSLRPQPSTSEGLPSRSATSGFGGGGAGVQTATAASPPRGAAGGAGGGGLGARPESPGAVGGPPRGGSGAARHSRRTLLIWSQAAAMVMAFALWLSVRGGQIRPGVIVALIGVSGVVTGLGIPAWQSFVAELVPRESLLNAVTLNSGQFKASRAIGFMLGGLALYSVGPGLSFFVNGLSFLAVLGAL